MIVSISNPAIGCDVCGCKLGGLYFGIMPQFDSHFIGVRYSSAYFKAAIRYNSEYLEDETSDDTYRRLDITGRFSINEKLKLNFILPYLSNVMNGSHQNIRSHGIGDPMVLLYYQAINNSVNNEDQVKHALLLGGGLKLPLGRFDAEDQGEIINRNFQMGSGSLDYLLSANYTIRRNAIGMNSESSYKINSRNKDEYRFGNQFNFSSYFFYWHEFKAITVLPYTGIYFEQAEKHQNHSAEEVNTGGHATFATLGAQAFKGNMTVNCMYQLPIAQRFNSDALSQIEAGNRFSISVMWNIQKKKDKVFASAN